MHQPTPHDLDNDKTGIFLGGSLAPSNSDHAHYLLVVEGPEQGRFLELGPEPITIGRHPQCGLSLPDHCISKQHCAVSLHANAVWVNDLGSTNGSYLNGVKIEGPTLWPEGVPLQVGNHRLRHEYRDRKTVEEAEKLTLDLKKASAYVQSLLPPPISNGPVAVDWHFEPSAVLGGDSFGYDWLDSERFAFYLVDVCGHGVGPAMHAVSVLNVLRQRSLVGVDFADPAQVLRKLNTAMPMEDHGEMFFSIWYGVYHRAARHLTFASAGHPPALLLTGEQLHELHTPHLFLGMMPGGEFSGRSLTLAPGSQLCVFSDGVFEFITHEGRDWTLPAFRDLVTEQAATGALQARDIHRTITRLARDGRLDDDFSLMILHFP